MTILRQIWAAYTEADRYLERRERGARSARGAEHWARLRDINNQAYFVMMFACFEDRITSLCTRLVARKKRLASWRSRRLWDTVDVERLDFMRKVALFMDRGRTDYDEVRKLYKDRCDIAHGRFTMVAVPSHYRDTARLWRTLKL